MNRFIKTNSLWLGLLGLGLILVLLTLIFSPQSPAFRLGATESLALIGGKSNRVELKDLAGKQLIDIRSSVLFEQGHAQNAINIPVRQLLDKESIKTLKELSKSGKDLVLYGTDELQATAPWLLLCQLGYKNLKIAGGGYSATGEFKESPVAATETSLFDVSALKINPEQKNATEIKIEKKKSETVVPVRKAASAGGGC